MTELKPMKEFRYDVKEGDLVRIVFKTREDTSKFKTQTNSSLKFELVGYTIRGRTYEPSFVVYPAISNSLDQIYNPLVDTHVLVYLNRVNFSRTFIDLGLGWITMGYEIIRRKKKMKNDKRRR